MNALRADEEGMGSPSQVTVAGGCQAQRRMCTVENQFAPCLTAESHHARVTTYFARRVLAARHVAAGQGDATNDRMTDGRPQSQRTADR